ncbi:MAG: exodeoxyribonuclease III [Eubacteriales bacterium]|nr:exodeoxyribonuclease III [Eubacteriales bacterium]MDD4323580.1 exodeoxyribonuclease III [Eubacteriales bacterium]MDD4541181.1 exodeoxyribonuclease III [Eubacteriales bacterium]
MKLHSWNVNGLRAILRKGFKKDYLKPEDPDILCLQEIKAHAEQVDADFAPYHVFGNSADRKGYSGTLTLTKEEPLAVSRGIGEAVFDEEGRVLNLEFPNFYLVNVYSPNSKDQLQRLDERMVFEDLFREYLSDLKKKKSVIVCGDLNVAHTEIDLKNPDTNRRSAGFTDEEREKFTQLLESGFVDTFRHFYPDLEDAYTWWSYRTRARERNAGWRIDYFLTSPDLLPAVKSAGILAEVMGSDHCPVELVLDPAKLS